MRNVALCWRTQFLRVGRAAIAIATAAVAASAAQSTLAATTAATEAETPPATVMAMSVLRDARRHVQLEFYGGYQQV